VVREQVAAMNIGERYEGITAGFDSIRDDAKSLVDQLEDGKISTWERFGNTWMKLTRGDIADRFDAIKDTYLEVAADSKDQIERERIILDAYRDYRGALKHAEVMALEVLQNRRRAPDGRGKKAPRWAPQPRPSPMRPEDMAACRPRQAGTHCATRACAKCRTRRSAIRLPRICRTI
jgi:hypothetical protein